MTAQDDERSDDLWRHGVAARFELLDAGEKSAAIQARIEAGRYLRIYEGVYAIGHAELTVAGRRRAAVLACGPRAVLSHRSAAGAWGLRPDGAARWDITVRQASPVAPAAPVRVFRHPTLRDDEIAELDGVPTTTVARVEVDGWSYHRSRRSFADDRRRDREALARGLRTMRFTADDVERTPGAVAPELALLLLARP